MIDDNLLVEVCKPKVKKEVCLGKCDRDVVRDQNQLILKCKSCKRVCKIIK